MEVLAILVLMLTARSALSQENAGTSLSPSLRECYNNTLLVTRDNRLPATINTLIALIRAAEEGNPNINARELSIQLLHRYTKRSEKTIYLSDGFRQDGLQRTKNIGADVIGLPYAPTDKENFLFQLQLTKLTPGNALTFNNNSLTPLERCSLHSMISSTIETNKRGDEESVCNSLSRYTSRLRKRRQSELTENNDNDPRGIFSECPLESGVVETKWGAVKAGLVLGGIAAGFNKNDVKGKNGTIDNGYGSTIAGQLAQATVFSLTSDISIGGKGYWNSTALPKYYFLGDFKFRKTFVTDAEIRGGLDGLFLAQALQKRMTTLPNLKISQILDLYYSPRGLFNKDFRACNRKLFETNQTLTQALIDQTRRYSYELDIIARAATTHTAETIEDQTRNAVANFNTYLASMNDVDCSSDEEVVERVSQDIAIFIDSNWKFEDIFSLISRILDNIDINKYESSYSVFSGSTGQIVVNKTTSSLNFRLQYNRTVHESLASGLDYNKVLETAEGLFRSKLDNSTDLKGQGTVLLLLPHSTPSASEKEFAKSKRDSSWKYSLPDLKILIISPVSRDEFASFVTNTNTDVIAFQDNADDNLFKEATKSIVSRLKKLPRDVVNPKCGSSYSSEQDATFELVQFVEPAGVNYHKIAPNYFHSGKEGREMKVKGYGYGDITVCMSRTEPNPGNGTTGDSCQVISASSEASYPLTCDGASVTSCSPIYLSVQGGATSQSRCNDAGCRFPDSIKYAIILENVRCESGSQQLISSFSMILFLFIAVIHKMF